MTTSKTTNTVFYVIITLLLALTAITAVFPKKYTSKLDKYCGMYSVDKSLVLALIKAESNFSKNAVSDADAKGLMQLTDSTFSYCNEKLGDAASFHNIFDPEKNIRAGVWYLSFLIDKYEGNITNAIAAYNAGIGNVDKWLSSPDYSSDGRTLSEIPFGETLRHVRKITVYKKIYDFIY